MEQARPSLGRWPTGLTASAFAWGVTLMGAAILLPVSGSESSSASVSSSGGHLATATHSATSTLLQANGYWVLIPTGIPALIAAIVWMALRRRRSHGSRTSGYLVWSSIGLLAAFCLLAILSIGVFVIPVAVALAVAASLTPAGAPLGAGRGTAIGHPCA
jgi:hypothetical protein